MLISKWFRRLLILATLVVIGVVWFLLQVFPIGGSGKEMVVTVHQGDSMAQIASELHQAGVLSSPLAFRAENLIFGAPLVRAGSYLIPQGASYFSVKSIIGNLPNVNVINVVPGLSLHEIAIDAASDEGNSFADSFYSESLHNGAQFMAKFGFANAPSSLEGLIGPGQYILLPNETPTELLNQMVKRFVAMAKQQGLTPTTEVRIGPRKTLDWYQLMTTASIVQKEGYYTSNMGKVARVIWNRLNRGGSLQMDSTVLYYYGADGGKVTPQMLQTRTPYNTYLNSGLTPTPICAVSSDALHYALQPTPGPWLYFVVIDKNGDEAFSSTFAQQLANERLAQQRGL